MAIHGVAFPHSQVCDILLSYGLPGVRGIQYPVYRGITPPPLGRLEAPGNRFSVIAILAMHRRAVMTETPAPYGRAALCDPSALARVFEAAGCRTQTELAAFLGVRQSSISDAKKRGSIPADWLLTLLWKTWINPIWVLTGQGTRTLQPAENAESVGEVSVPIVVRCPPPDCTTDELVQEIVRRAVRRMAWNEDEVCLIVSDGTCSCATMPKK